MSEIFSSIENIFILYGPTVLLFLTQFVDWFVTLRQFKLLNVSNQINPLVEKTQKLINDVSKYKEDIERLTKENIELAKTVASDKEVIEDIKGMLAESNAYMNALSQENIELKAEIRRKICVATEQNNV